MADLTPTDNFDNQPENDFEKINAPSNGFDQEGDGLIAAAADVDEPAPAAPSQPQDGEVSTTTAESTDNAGEDIAEEDQFNVIDASEVEELDLDIQSQQSLENQEDPSLASGPGSPDAEVAEADQEGVGSPDDSGLLVDVAEEDQASESPSAEAEEDDEPVQTRTPEPEEEIESPPVQTDLVPEPENEEDVSVSEFPESQVSASEADGPSTPQEEEVLMEDQVNDSPITEEAPQISQVHETEEEPVQAETSEPPEEEDSSLSPVQREEPVVVPEDEDISEPVVLEEEDVSEIADSQPSASEADGSLTPQGNEQLIGDDDLMIIPDVAPVVQSSAPVPEPEPEHVEPLVQIDNSSDPDLLLASSSISVVSSDPPSVIPEPQLIPSDDSVSDNVQQNVFETDTNQVSEQSSVDSSKGSWLKGVDPRESVADEDYSILDALIDLIYWRDVKKTGVVFGTMMTVLLCLAIFSLVSVLAYLSLALLTVSFSFVVYKKIMAAVQKSGDGHPFKCILEKDITLQEEKLKTVIQALLNNINKTVSELRRLFFIEDIVDSIKFGLMLWLSTYIGCCLNGITLVILAVIMLFSLPKVYETYQVQIDQHVGMAKAQINGVLEIVQSKLPFLKKKEKAQ